MRAWAVIWVILAGCGGKQTWSSDMNWSETPANEDKPLRETEEVGAPPATLTDADAGTSSSLIGVRHDVMIAPAAPHEAKCPCLAVEVGPASNDKLQWQHGPPVVGDALVIAVSAKVDKCAGGDADPAKRRASISAVDQDGADVTVEIEEVPDGRPIASGAVIPRPGAGGAVYVRGKNKKVPYAGVVRCRVN